jgi:uncharacterized protein (TIGR02246 family)
LSEEWETHVRTPDIEWLLSNYYADDALRLWPNQLPLEGREAFRAVFQEAFDRATYDMDLTVQDTKVSGDLAVARGTYEESATPRTGGGASPRDVGKWVAVYQKQADGSWRCSYDIWNSSQPAPGTTEDGVEEKALEKIERDFFDAFNKSDTAALESILAKEWTYLFEGQITTRSQLMADIRKGAYKIESAQLNDFKAHVVGDAAIVTTTITLKGTYNGADISGSQRSIDLFVKQDGGWQVIRTQNTVIKP